MAKSEKKTLKINPKQLRALMEDLHVTVDGVRITLPDVDDVKENEAGYLEDASEALEDYVANVNESIDPEGCDDDDDDDDDDYDDISFDDEDVEESDEDSED